MQLNFDRLSGRHWLWGANTKIDSENFETNDFAILNGADGWLCALGRQFERARPFAPLWERTAMHESGASGTGMQSARENT